MFIYSIIITLAIALVLLSIMLCIACGFKNAQRLRHGERPEDLDNFSAHIYAIWWPQRLACFFWITWQVQKHFYRYR